VLADRTVTAKRRSFEDVLRWGRGLGADRVWAIEDCRHVSGALERFLLRRGERVVRVAPKLMADTRHSGRERGKSDVIDAVAIPGPRCARGPTRCPSPSSPAPNATCGCSSTTANGSSRSAPR